MSIRSAARTGQALVVGALLLLPVSPPTAARRARAQTAAAPLEQAVSKLRHIYPERLTDEQKGAKSREIEEAWGVITKAGPAGAARLKQELALVQAGRESDDFFKLSAAALLWESGKLAEAETIAAVWNSTPHEVHYNYVFYPGVEAARTQDARALPMLEAILKSDRGGVFLGRHALNVRWPLSHEFVWGAFGPKGLPRLLEVINASGDAIATKSAVVLLAQAQELKALARIRELARGGQGDARLLAVRALGIYGHPQDYDFLLNGLRSDDPKEVFAFAAALYEYDDLRAVPHLVPLLAAKDASVRREAFAALTHLPTSEGVDALHRYSKAAPTKEERDAAGEHLENELKEYGLTLAAYLASPPPQRAASIARMLERREAGRHALAAGERGPTRAALVAAAAEWKKAGRMATKTTESGSYELRHILSGATPEDIPLLLEAKAAFYPRLSDEALYEVRRIDAAVKLLGRGRYRKVPGITKAVEAR